MANVVVNAVTAAPTTAPPSMFMNAVQADVTHFRTTDHSLVAGLFGFLSWNKYIPAQNFPSQAWWRWLLPPSLELWPALVLILLGLVVCWYMHHRMWSGDFEKDRVAAPPSTLYSSEWDRDLEKKFKQYESKGKSAGDLPGQLLLSSRAMRGRLIIGGCCLWVFGLCAAFTGIYSIRVMSFNLDNLAPEVKLISDEVKKLQPLAQNVAVNAKDASKNCAAWKSMNFAPEVEELFAEMPARFNNVSVSLLKVLPVTQFWPEYVKDARKIVGDLKDVWSWIVLAMVITTALLASCYAGYFLWIAEKEYPTIFERDDQQREHADFEVPWVQLQVMRPNNIKCWKALGWTEKVWDTDDWKNYPVSEKKPWHKLTRPTPMTPEEAKAALNKPVALSELEAAKELGFTRATWDIETPEERFARMGREVVFHWGSCPVMVLMMLLVCVAAFLLTAGLTAGAYCYSPVSNTLSVVDQLSGGANPQMQGIMEHYLTGTPADNIVIDAIHKSMTNLAPIEVNRVKLNAAIRTIELRCPAVDLKNVGFIGSSFQQFLPFTKRDWVIRRWDSIINVGLCGSFVNSIFWYIVATLFVALFIIPSFAMTCHRYMLMASETQRRKEVAEDKEHEKLVKKNEKKVAQKSFWEGCFTHKEDHKPLIWRPDPWTA